MLFTFDLQSSLEDCWKSLPAPRSLITVDIAPRYQLDIGLIILGCAIPTSISGAHRAAAGGSMSLSSSKSFKFCKRLV